MKRGVILGLGSMGQTHRSRYRRLGVEICAVVDSDAGRRAEARRQGLPAYGELHEVEMAGVDFVDICTPTDRHYEQIRAVMALGKAIFVEKPVVRTRAEVAALRGSGYGGVIFVGEVEQYNPRLREFVDGAPQPGGPRAPRWPRWIEMRREVNLEYFLRGARPWFLDEERSGGMVLDLMIHDLTLLVCKYGRPQVRSAEGKKTRYDLIDEAQVVLAFDRAEHGAEAFEARVSCTWAGRRTDAPVVAEIRWQEADGALRSVRCEDYHIRRVPGEEDGFLAELTAFLQSLETGRTSWPLAQYLDGIDLALAAAELMR